MNSNFSSKANSVVHGQESSNQRYDIVSAIRQHTFRTKPREKKIDTLLPTLPNLYGLSVRFKYSERIMKEEKDRRRLTSLKK